VSRIITLVLTVAEATALAHVMGTPPDRGDFTSDRAHSACVRAHDKLHAAILAAWAFR
jgi:hypothetical protein